jgi:predicted dehydrogenase
MGSLLNVGVVGCGRMGRLHARVFSQMPNVKLAGVFDADGDQAAATAEQYGTVACASLGELLGKASAVVVAVPTKFHLPVARECAAAGVHMLIEKPLASTAVECREVAELAKSRGLTVQVGHVERFNPAIRAMTRLEIRPRFIEVTRVSPLTFRSIDVGVVLDMMIHDIDIVLLLAGGLPVTSVEAVGVSVIGGAEDVCNARVRFGSGEASCVANLTASRLALKTDRKLRVFSTDGYVSIDYQKKYGIVARRSGNVEAIRDAAAKIRSGEVEDLSQLNYADLVSVEELQIDDVEPLRAELDAFVEAVATKTPPVVDVTHGAAAVELAERIVAAIGGTSI